MNNRYLDMLAYFGIGSAHPGGASLTKKILSGENILPDDHVLEIGCGTGETTTFLTQTYGCLVTAVDNHPINIEKAGKRLENQMELINIVETDVQSLPFSSNMFDFVLAESVISFTTIDNTLSELFRVLKPNGSLIVNEMTAEKLISESIQKKVSKLYGIEKILSEDEWKERIRGAGFTHIDVIDTPIQLTQTEVTDVDLSNSIPMELYDLWDQHVSLVEQLNTPLGYRVFRCQ